MSQHSLDRLTRAKYGSRNKSEEFEMDDLGNRVSVTVHTGSGPPTNYYTQAASLPQRFYD